ncbi:MAG: Crp/Fnr family transcriptional regulator [Variovorax sp.]|nr:MAG: Crp/Fnr family transcriptional regulator [Variovorax sp.]
MSAPQNHLIETLPPADRDRLLALCKPVQLLFGDVLCQPGDTLRHVHFPVDGFISLLANTDDHPGLEVGMVGREGMLGVHMALGVARAPLHALVQGEGMAWRASASVFREALAHSAPLRRLVGRYTYVMMLQQSASAGCLRYHLIAPRLARWLLMTQDRAHTERFRVTQDFMAYMLGVRRVGVTAAARMLQDGGLIRYARGDLTVLDRSGLEAAACSCYATDAASYARQLRDAAAG